MRCDDLVRYLSDYLDHNLEESLAAEAQAHLATCHNCRVVLDTTQQTILLYRERGKQLAMPAARHARLFEQLAKALGAAEDTRE